MTERPTRRELLRVAAATGGALVGPGGVRGRTGEESDSDEQPFVYSCDVASQPGETPDVTDTIRVERVSGTFGPTLPECFSEPVTLYRYLFAQVRGPRPGHEGILWGTDERLQTGVYEITNVSVCVDAPSGYCARQPFYRILLGLVESA